MALARTLSARQTSWEQPQETCGHDEPPEARPNTPEAATNSSTVHGLNQRAEQNAPQTSNGAGDGSDLPPDLSSRSGEAVRKASPHQMVEAIAQASMQHAEPAVGTIPPTLESCLSHAFFIATEVRVPHKLTLKPNMSRTNRPQQQSCASCAMASLSTRKPCVDW